MQQTISTKVYGKQRGKGAGTQTAGDKGGSTTFVYNYTLYI